MKKVLFVLILIYTFSFFSFFRQNQDLKYKNEVLSFFLESEPFGFTVKDDAVGPREVKDILDAKFAEYIVYIINDNKEAYVYFTNDYPWLLKDNKHLNITYDAFNTFENKVITSFPLDSSTFEMKPFLSLSNLDLKGKYIMVDTIDLIPNEQKFYEIRSISNSLQIMGGGIRTESKAFIPYELLPMLILVIFILQYKSIELMLYHDRLLNTVKKVQGFYTLEIIFNYLKFIIFTYAISFAIATAYYYKTYKVYQIVINFNILKYIGISFTAGLFILVIISTISINSNLKNTKINRLLRGGV